MNHDSRLSSAPQAWTLATSSSSSPELSSTPTPQSRAALAHADVLRPLCASEPCSRAPPTRSPSPGRVCRGSTQADDHWHWHDPS
eukprot:1116637-Rhodomonas_salina.1